MKVISKVAEVKINPVRANLKSFKDVLSQIVENHQSATKIVEQSLNKDELSPQKLIKIQYKTGLFFLKEQTFCKTVEISAGSLKSFTQMQV